INQEKTIHLMKTLLVVTDLGCCKLFNLDWTSIQHTPRLEFIEDFPLSGAHEKLLERITDVAGRYRIPNSRMAMSYAERQKLPAELKRRLIRQIASHLNEFFKKEQPEMVYLAADKEIYHQVLDQLDATLRERIEKTIAANLTKVHKADLLEHFGT